MDETISVPAASSAKKFLYAGRSLLKTDHGRISLPVRWRMEGMPVDFVVSLWPIGSALHLLVLPVPRWEDFLQELMGRSLLDRTAASGLRELGANTGYVSLDSAGRLTLPEDLVKKAAIKEKAELFGLFDRFEVWNPERYEMMEKDHSNQVAVFFNEVANETRNTIRPQP